MRYTGYYLSDNVRKQEHAITTVEDCWEACLQETSFRCLALAYTDTGSQSCLLYDNRALSVYENWTYSSDFTYYEYCVNGEWDIVIFVIQFCFRLCATKFIFLVSREPFEVNVNVILHEDGCCLRSSNIMSLLPPVDSIIKPLGIFTSIVLFYHINFHRM